MRQLPTGLRFSILHRSFLKQLDRLLQEKGLTGVQFGVLGQLRRLEESGQAEINQRDLENAAHVTHPTMTEIVKRLEKQGFVACEPSARDRRFKRIRSTDRAAALLCETQELDERVFRRLTQGLSESEVASLLSVTDKMIENAALCCDRKGGEAACDQELP